jgi:hypothetical protein
MVTYTYCSTMHVTMNLKDTTECGLVLVHVPYRTDHKWFIGLVYAWCICALYQSRITDKLNKVLAIYK